MNGAHDQDDDPQGNHRHGAQGEAAPAHEGPAPAHERAAHGHERHAHAHGGHAHAHGAGQASTTALAWSVVLVLGFGVLEIVVGFASGSLALASDGVHMLTDAVALALALGAKRLARRKPVPHMTFGYGRAEPLAALANSLFYLGVLGFIVSEAIARMLAPPPIEAGFPLLVAVIGLLVNAAVWRLLHGQRHELNTRGALLHVIGDFAGSAIAIIALVTIWLTGWMLIDPILTLLISALLLAATLRLLRDSVRVLMNAVPEGVDPGQVEATLRSPAGVRSVHDLHLWSLGDGSAALAAHLAIDDMAHWPHILLELRRIMDQRHHIRHLTLQPEAALDEALLQLRQAEADRDLNRDMALRFERELEAQRRELSGTMQRELGVQLTSLRSMAETLEARLLPREPSLARLATFMLRSADAMSASIRSLVARVRNDGMQGESLPDGLRALVDDWRMRRPEARIELLLEPVQDRSFGLGAPGVEALAWRIADHALARALLEAGAATVVLSAISEEGQLRLQISDDGRPFEAPHAARAPDAGAAAPAAEEGGSTSRLAQMADRVCALGGRCTIGPGEAGGAEILVRLPWSG
ncbi:MAG: cation diffusion facilitator family transporter [Burkholderiaceae bacterium]|nr:cation diffusion facilitator family transporter [Burkholderiaceae bacterium]